MPDDPLGLGRDWFETSPAQPEPEASSQPPCWDDEPPPEEPYFDDEVADYVPPSDGPLPGFTPSPVRTVVPTPDADPDDPEVVLATLRTTFAAMDGRAAPEVTALVTRITSADGLLDRLPDDLRSAWDAMLETISFECSLLEGVGSVDFSDLPAMYYTSPATKNELDAIRQLAADGDVPSNPILALEALIEAQQGAQTRRAALSLIRAIDERVAPSVKMERFRNIPAPTRVRDVQNNTWARTAAEWFEDEAAVDAAGPSIILSSGLPTLDRACSGTGDEPGLIRPGEFWLGAAGTGHGKSAFTRRFVTAATEDLVNGWGYPEGRTLIAFTEEEAPDVARAAMLGRGQPFHHLANNVTLGKVGESRKRLVYMVYDAVAAAVRRSMETGAPLTEYLPYLFVLDYIQAVKEPGEAAATDAVSRTADLLMRGIAAWDPEMMSSISGVDFQSYTGMSWPDGIDHHRVAVFVLSQLRKVDDRGYRSGKSDIADFAVLNENGVPYWAPQEDDYAIPKRDHLFGSSTLLNHATGLIFLHRSQPQASVMRRPDKSVIGLSDTRAHFLVPKARKSVAMPFIPARFDSNPEGFRGQFYDDLAHEALMEGRIEVQDCYQREGDPMLPKRPARTPFVGVPY